LKDPRKTECGANRFRIHLAVRAAPFCAFDEIRATNSSHCVDGGDVKESRNWFKETKL